MKKISIIAIASLMILSFALSSYAIPADDLVLYYSFDAGGINGNTAKDLSGNGYDGTINGGAKLANGVLEFDGKDGYVVTPALDIVRTGEFKLFTAICRFKTDTAANGPLWMWGDNANPNSSSGAEAPMGWRSTTGNFCAGFYSNAHFYAEAETDYADNNWHFAAQVGDEALGYLYVDGKQLASATAGYIYAAPAYCLIGARTKNSGSDIDDVEYFVGAMSMVAIYARVLDENDMNEIASEILAVSESGKLTTQWGQIKQ